jgi:hypothetical protein
MAKKITAKTGFPAVGASILRASGEVGMLSLLTRRQHAVGSKVALVAAFAVFGTGM